MFRLPNKFPDLPPFLEAVATAVSAERLKAVAGQTQEPQVLLGLAFLARAGDPVRRELSQQAVNAKPEYGPMLAMLALAMDGVDEPGVAELLKADPDNALGHYLQGTLRHIANGREEALGAFRKAARCAELRLYQPVTGEALFKALDALSLQGAERLCALAWMASRAGNFQSGGLQPIARALGELAQAGDKAEIADLLFRLAGHLSVLNLQTRWLGQRALESAFMLKVERAAAEKSPDLNGYAAVVEALVGQWMSWPGFEDQAKPSELAHFLPERIHRAFAMADPAKATAAYLGEMNAELAGSEKAAFEQARDRASQAAAVLLKLALADPDGTIGPFLKGLPPRPTMPDGRPCIPQTGPVGKLAHEKPDLFKAAAANEEAMRALWRAGQNDPRRRNMERMMRIGWAILNYASVHDDTFPANLERLFQEGLLQPPLEPRSVLTGQPYVYLAAGEKRPAKSSDAVDLVLLYDDDLSRGYHEGFFALGYGGAIRPQDLQEQLKRRGKG